LSSFSRSDGRAITAFYSPIFIPTKAAQQSAPMPSIAMEQVGDSAAWLPGVVHRWMYRVAFNGTIIAYCVLINQMLHAARRAEAVRLPFDQYKLLHIACSVLCGDAGHTKYAARDTLEHGLV